jgi:small neutral amino acid transporter SnatA (MarC family)
MAKVRAQTWRTVLVIALVVFVLGLIFGGYLIWYIGIVILLLAMAGGALLSRTLGPPER